MKKYNVYFVGHTTIYIEAENRDQAVNKAWEEFNGGVEIKDVEISEVEEVDQ